MMKYALEVNDSSYFSLARLRSLYVSNLIDSDRSKDTKRYPEYIRSTTKLLIIAAIFARKTKWKLIIHSVILITFEIM